MRRSSTQDGVPHDRAREAVVIDEDRLVYRSIRLLELQRFELAVESMGEIAERLDERGLGVVLADPVNCGKRIRGSQHVGLFHAEIRRLRCEMGSVPQLQSVLIEMIVEAADFPAASFDSVVSISAEKSGGRILFNVRTDSHANVQRVAAIADESSEGVTLLLLDRAGASIRIHEVPVEYYPLVVSIARWADQPLHAQATTSVSLEVMSLLEIILLSRGT